MVVNLTSPLLQRPGRQPNNVGQKAEARHLLSKRKSEKMQVLNDTHQVAETYHLTEPCKAT